MKRTFEETISLLDIASRPKNKAQLKAWAKRNKVVLDFDIEPELAVLFEYRGYSGIWVVDIQDNYQINWLPFEGFVPEERPNDDVAKALGLVLCDYVAISLSRYTQQKAS